MSYQFEVVTGPAAGQTFSLEDGQSLKIGRGQASDTKLDDPHMSRLHFGLTAADGVVTLADLGSSSGTLVDGRAVQTLVLEPGTTFRAGNSEIRLLKAGGADDETLRGAPGPAAGSRPSGPVPSLPELVGRQLGAYRVDKIITATASGMIFKGHDVEKDRPVAVKVLTPSTTGSDEQKERFVRAMKTMLPIRDRHLVTLYGAGKTGPFCWAAMEFIEGESITDVIARIGIEGMLDWKAVWRVAMDVGRALVVADQHKIIHRNVTPANIMRRHEDKSCVLGDLMLAKALEGALAVAVTQPGQMIGDLPYMSPERTRGTENVDARSDLYGLGATCYALLTGRPPFLSDSLGNLIQAVRTQEPQPPKAFQLAINDMFQAVVMKLLAKEPGNRYPTATAMLMELERIGKLNNMTAG
jgi:serine/threonine protein kinase